MKWKAEAVPQRQMLQKRDGYEEKHDDQVNRSTDNALRLRSVTIVTNNRMLRVLEQGLEKSIFQYRSKHLHRGLGHHSLISIAGPVITTSYRIIDIIIYH